MLLRPTFAFIPPALPSTAERPPIGGGWIHEIKHDGYRMMVRRDAPGVRLLTRNGKDWTGRFPTIVQATSGLKARSCLIDGEVVCCDENRLAVFALLRYRERPAAIFLYAFDLLELDGQDLPNTAALNLRRRRAARPGFAASPYGFRARSRSRGRNASSGRL